MQLIEKSHFYSSTSKQGAPDRLGALMWLITGTLIIAIAFAVTVTSSVFAQRSDALMRAVLPFALGYVIVGAALAWMLHAQASANTTRPRRASDVRMLLLWIFAVGLVARCMLFASTPILEVDFNRYLWDGGMTARGYNPFALSPKAVGDLAYNDLRLEMAKAAGDVFEAISYPALKTIYPPVAQAVFAFAHWLSPWSLTAWRFVILAADIATFVLLLALLRSIGRPDTLIAYYWWSPLALKELINSAHMEAILLPCVLAAVLAAVKRRPLLSMLALGLAVGVKLWPLLLAPLLLRSRQRNVHTAWAAALLLALVAVMAAPVVASGFDRSSGFVAFANHWSTNSAHMPALDHLLRSLTGWGDPADLRPGRIARSLAALALITVVTWVSRQRWHTAHELVTRVFVIASAIVLLSPAQFPWYVLWVLPFAALHASVAWAVAAALVPLYYTSFHFAEIGMPALHRRVTVWLIWVPVWILLAREAFRTRAGGDAPALEKPAFDRSDDASHGVAR